MKKIIFIALGLFAFDVSNVFAYTEVCSVLENGECSPGCEFDEPKNMCKLCTPGTYSNEDGVCVSSKDVVGFPLYLDNWEYVGDGAEDVTECKVKIFCDAGEYLDTIDMTTVQGTKIAFNCAKCGAYYDSGESADGFEFFLKFDMTLVDENNEVIPDITDYSVTRCGDGRVAKLILDRNTWVGFWEDIEAYAKYNVGFAMDENPTGGWSNGVLPDKAVQGDRPIKTFKGYWTGENCDGTMFFDADGKFNGNWSGLFDSMNSNGEITLFSCWENYTIAVGYKNPTGSGSVTWYTQNITIDDNSEGQSFPIMEYGGEPGGEGMVFQHYTCTYTERVGEQDIVRPCSSTQTVWRPGEEIPLVGTNITFTPVFGACAVGYYCVGGEQIPCPMGTTSNIGAGAESQCFMTRGTDGTQFCDGQGRCFTLPGTGNINYEPD